MPFRMPMLSVKPGNDTEEFYEAIANYQLAIHRTTSMVNVRLSNGRIVGRIASRYVQHTGHQVEFDILEPLTLDISGRIPWKIPSKRFILPVELYVDANGSRERCLRVDPDQLNHLQRVSVFHPTDEFYHAITRLVPSDTRSEHA